MNIQEPDFSEMIRKSDSARRQAILNNSSKTLKTKSKTVVLKEKQKPQIIAIKKTSNNLTSTTKPPVTKLSTKKIINKPANKTLKKVTKKQKIVIDGIIYTVQIAALDSADKKYSGIKNVITYNENSLIKYSLGSFKTFNEAQNFRSQIIGKYKGAFVKALKNNIPIEINK